MKKHLITFLTILFAALALQAQDVMPARFFKQTIDENNNVQLLDVRTRKEFADIHMENAVNIDVLEDHFIERVKENFTLDKPIYLYCKSGGRSNIASEKLQAAGYKTVDLKGGIISWKLEGFKVIEGVND